MIRVRARDGALVDLPPAAHFVEITDLDGNLAVVVYAGGDGSVHSYTSADPQFQSYCRLMKIDKAVKVLAVPSN